MTRAISDPDAAVRVINAGFWAARALSSAVEVGLFDTMGKRAWEPTELADACGIRPRGTEALLRFLVAFGFAEQAGQHYRLTAFSQRLLSREPSALRTEAPVAPDVWTAMEGLTETLRGNPGRTTDRFFSRLGASEVAGFAETMEVQARRLAPMLGEKIDLTGRTRLLDLGGGSGHLGGRLADRFAGLDVLILDRPEVVKYVRERRQERTFRMVAGDLWTTDPRMGHDVLLLSRVLHDWDDRHAALLLKRWIEPMPVGGLVIVCEVMAETVPGPGQQWAALLDVFLFAVLGEGRVRAAGEIAGLLTDADCHAVAHEMLADGSTMLLAHRL